MPIENPFVEQIEGLLTRAQSMNADTAARGEENIQRVVAALQGIQQAVEAIVEMMEDDRALKKRG